MDELNNCPICSNRLVEERHDNDKNIYHLACPVCGSYSATEEAVDEISTERKLKEKWYILAGLVRTEHENGTTVSLRTTNLQSFIDSASPPRGPLEAVDRILLYLESKTPFFGEFIEVNSSDFSITYSPNFKEFENYLSLANKLNYLDNIKDTRSFTLTYKGWQRIDELRKTKRIGNQAFVAMWFTEDMRSAWNEGFKPALESADYSPIRIDLLEYNEKIDDRIISEIRRSSILIADFTGNRGGVYFEAGFAMGLGIPVIWTCRKDHVAGLHFDTRQYNHIVWEHPSELLDKLTNRIEATIQK